MQLKDNLMKSKPSHYLMRRPFLGRSLTRSQKSRLSGTAGPGEGSGFDAVAPGLTLRERGPHAPFCCLGLWPWLHLTRHKPRPGTRQPGGRAPAENTCPARACGHSSPRTGSAGTAGSGAGPGVPSSLCAERPQEGVTARLARLDC